jgi:hypothetical protein
MQEISPITKQQAPTEPAKTTPTGITDSFSQLLEVLLGIGEPAPPNLPSTIPGTAVPEKPGTPDETLIREIQELIQQAGTAPESPVDSIACPKKTGLPTKITDPQAPNDKNNAPCVALGLADQLLAVPAGTANSGKPPLERPEPAIKGLEIRTLSSMPSLEQPVPSKLNLEDFDVTGFEYKIEADPGGSDAQSRLLPELQAELMLRNSISAREPKPAKLNSDYDALTHDSGSSPESLTPPATIVRSEAVQHVQLVFEPPPAPPTVRSVSMDIGDAESQVRVVIREKNGNLNIQFGAANERLRQDLQTSGPLLLRELQRDNPLPVTLDFSNFGSATESDRRPRYQWQSKKTLKPEAEFADAAETAHLSPSSSISKSIGLQ